MNVIVFPRQFFDHFSTVCHSLIHDEIKSSPQTNLVKLQGHFDKMFGYIVSPTDQDVVGIDNFPFLQKINQCLESRCNAISLQSWEFSLHDTLHSWCPEACFVIGFLNATWLSWSDYHGEFSLWWVWCLQRQRGLARLQNVRLLLSNGFTATYQIINFSYAFLGQS